MPPKSCAPQQRERQEGLKAGRQYADYQKKKQNIIGSGNIKQKILAMSAAQKREKTEYECQRKVG